MVRTSISSSFDGTRLSNWASGSTTIGTPNPVGGYSEYSFENLEELRPKPARALRPHLLPSQSSKPVRGMAPATAPRDSHREWHCDSERKSLPRGQRAVPNRGTFSNKIGTFGKADVRRTRGFGEWAPPAVCVVSWDPFNAAKAEVPTWATHKRGARQQFARQRLVGEHLGAGTLTGERRRSGSGHHAGRSPQRRAQSALDNKPVDAGLSVGGGRLSADLVEREGAELISADRVIATPNGTQCRLNGDDGDSSPHAAPVSTARKQSQQQQQQQQRPPSSNTLLEPIAAPAGFSFAPPSSRPATTAPKSKDERLDDLMEAMIADNELQIVDLKTRIDATVDRATALWPWADADMTATALGPRY
jgi:hypothetical protein